MVLTHQLPGSLPSTHGNHRLFFQPPPLNSDLPADLLGLAFFCSHTALSPLPSRFYDSWFQVFSPIGLSISDLENKKERKTFLPPANLKPNSPRLRRDLLPRTLKFAKQMAASYQGLISGFKSITITMGQEGLGEAPSRNPPPAVLWEPVVCPAVFSLSIRAQGTPLPPSLASFPENLAETSLRIGNKGLNRRCLGTRTGRDATCLNGRK